MSIPPIGNRAVLPFTDTLTIREGQIVRSEVNFNLEELKRQFSGR